MVWFFAYGSLIWDWKYDYIEKSKAILENYHRDFNKKSVRNWGSEDNPAPVLGLEEGGNCEGVAYKVSDGKSDKVFRDLKQREGSSYTLKRKKVTIDSCGIPEAFLYLNKRDSSYIGDIKEEKRVKMSLRASGQKGTGEDYVEENYQHLKQAEIKHPNVKRYRNKMTEEMND